MSMLKQELNLFLIALSFLSRIPVPANIDFSQQNLNHASRYFSLVGWLIGLICAAIYWIAAEFFPTNVSVLLSMLVSVLLTGCFHEDGLADTCDGLGGGWSQQQKLSIMKDSRIGTYGAVGLWLALTLKLSVLVSLPEIGLAMLVAHPISRTVSTSMIFLLPYVTETEQSKVKPLAESHSKIDLQINLLFAGLALLLVYQHVLVLLGVLVLNILVIRYWLKKQIQGFTGDALGATQQISEISIYLVLLAGATS